MERNIENAILSLISSGELPHSFFRSLSRAQKKDPAAVIRAAMLEAYSRGRDRGNLEGRNELLISQATPSRPRGGRA